MRIILVGLFLLVFFICSLLMFPVLWVVGKFNKNAKNVASFRIVQWAFKVILFISGTKLTVIGKENIPDDRAVLFIGNHRSIFDVLVHYVNIKRPMGFISKIEVKKVPILNIWMNNVNCLFLDRDDIKQGMKVILAAIEQVKEGISICIFPEGTRCKVEGEMLPFKDGSFKIAKKSNCDIIPFAINNSAAIFEDNGKLIKRAKVVIEYGAPIVMEGLDRDALKELPDKTREMILEMVHKNKQVIE